MIKKSVIKIICLKTTSACTVDERQRTVGRTGIAW